MSRPHLAPNGVIAVTVPWGNTTTQIEIDPLTPPGMVNAIARFDFGPGIDLADELVQIAEKLTYLEPSAVLLSLSPEMRPGGVQDAADLREAIGRAAGAPCFTTTEGTFWRLRELGISRIGIITPTPAEGAEAAAASFGAQGFSVLGAHGLDCGRANIKAATPEQIVDAVGSIDHPDVEAFVQVGTGLPAFAAARRVEEQFGRPLVTTNTAGYLQLVDALGLRLP